jgi:hypothetical protein
MAAGQREFGFIVIKLSRLPGVGRVAYFASLGETALHVVRVLAVLEILQVTGDAGSLSEIVVAVDVTISALARRNGMGASQRESGFGVIEVRRRPGYRRVASLTSLRESLLRVVRIICFLKILQVARDAGSLSQVVVVVNVAIGARARRHSMCTCQGKPSQCMIKAGIQPIIGRVARLASSRKFSGYVVGIPGRLQIFLMATQASRRHSGEIAECAVLVAVVTSGGRVCAGERKAVHVLIDLLHRNFPTADCVAGLASRAHLTPVDVGVAVGAFGTDIAENHLGVTGRASYPFVHAA